MLLYSIIFPIISVIVIIFFLSGYLKGKYSLLSLIFWVILWSFVIVFSIFPSTTSIFAKIFGITRGLDFVIIIVFAVLFYTISRLYMKLDKLQDDVNTIVKDVALSNEISLDDEEDKP